ncbi:MAG: hypothetical protein ACAH11_11965 [Sphingomonas sp.]
MSRLAGYSLAGILLAGTASFAAANSANINPLGPLGAVPSPTPTPTAVTVAPTPTPTPDASVKRPGEPTTDENSNTERLGDVGGVTEVVVPVSGTTTAAPRAAAPFSSARGSTELYLARAAEDAGEGGKTLEIQQGVYDKAINAVRVAQPGSSDRIENIRVAMQAGYELAWSRYDQNAIAQGDAIIAELTALLDPFDTPPNIRKEALLPITRLTWLKSRQAEVRNDRGARDIYRKRVLQLTLARNDYRRDYGPMTRLRYQALSVVTGAGAAQARVEARHLGEEFEKDLPGSGLAMLLACDIDDAWTAIDTKKLPEASKAIGNALARIAKVKARRGLVMNEATFLISIENLAAYLDFLKGDLIGRARHQIAAGEAFAGTFNGKIYTQARPDELLDMYNEFRLLDISVIPEYKGAAAQSRFLANFYKRIGDALTRMRTTYPKSHNLAMIQGDSLGRAANQQFKNFDYEGAADTASRAVAAFHEGEVVAALTEFSDYGEGLCVAAGTNARAQAEVSDFDTALAAYRAAETLCGEWLKRYPWDRFARQHLTNASVRMAKAFEGKQRYLEAIPLLESASNWGSRDASTMLGRFYRRGLGVTADPARAAALDKLAVKQRFQPITIKADFGGANYDVEVYISHYGPKDRCPIQAEPLTGKEDCAGFEGIDDQVKWLRVARNAIIDPALVEKFRQADRRARDRDLPFPDTALAIFNPNLLPEKTGVPMTAKTNTSGGTGLPVVEVTAMPAILGTRFFAFDNRPEDPELIDTTRVSRGGPARCYGWMIKVAPQNGRITLREELLLPAVPASMPRVLGNSTILNNGQKTVTQVTLSLADGELRHSWCASIDDPLGKHRIDVFFGDSLVKSFTFELIK